MDSIDTLEASNLACMRGGRVIFERLSFSVAAGKVLIVEGPNGAGKTSLLRIVAGLLTQSEGAARARAGTRVVDDREERGHLCALIGHQDGIKAQLTVAENARFFAGLYRSHASIDAALERTGLARLTTAPAQYLSAGQRRRLALARLLLVARPVWLLDEPFASLDSEGRALVTELVQQHCAAGGIAIAATHEPIVIAASRVVLGPP